MVWMIMPVEFACVKLRTGWMTGWRGSIYSLLLLAKQLPYSQAKFKKISSLLLFRGMLCYERVLVPSAS